MTRASIALIVVTVLLSACHGAVTQLDNTDFLHTDDEAEVQELCKSLPSGIELANAVYGHVIC